MPVLRASHGGTSNSLPGQLPGEFIYMFPKLADDNSLSKPAGLSDAEYLECLKTLGTALTVTTGNCRHGLPTGNLSKLPPAHTYFGQFIDHDMTAPVFVGPANAADDGNSEFRPNDAAAMNELKRSKRLATTGQILGAVKNHWPKPFNLQSLYGDGPEDGDQDIQKMYDGGRLRLLSARDFSNAELVAKGLDPALTKRLKGFDIARAEGEPLIADHRNDENLILSQMHCQMLKFHNRVLAKIGGKKSDFDEARDLVTRHIHWITLHDYLPRILNRPTLKKVMNEAKTGKVLSSSGVPMEFTAAAFRFGHSMIRQCYDYNINFGADSPFESMADLSTLFMFTSTRELSGQNGVAGVLPSHWVAEWKRLLRPSLSLFFANGIDGFFANTMNKLDAPQGAAAHFRQIGSRNLMRGFLRRVPSGQALANAFGVAPLASNKLKLTPEHLAGLAAPGELKLLNDSQYTKLTPAWYYFLCEAMALHKGERLGPVASEIIARTIVGAIQYHPGSVIGGKWKPSKSPLKRADGGAIRTLGDILELA